MLLRLGALVLICASIFIAIDLVLPEESQLKLKTLFLSQEQKTLYSECEQARKNLHVQGVPSQYSSVEFMIRDARLEKDPILQDLKRCFLSSEKSPINLEVELFSSDYGTESSSDIQVQISAFDKNTKNKVAETGFRMDHEPYEAKSSTTPKSASPVSNSSTQKN